MSAPLSMLGCLSHSPLAEIRPRAPEQEAQVLAQATALRAQVEAFQPERVVFFNNNHFAGFHCANMPAYCVGTRCTAVDDLGGTPGEIPVPADQALELLTFLREADFDPAISYHMPADHGMSQPLARVFGRLDALPVIPLFINCFTPPLMRFGRTRRLGEAVGRWIRDQGRRTLVMGSGGLSHHPVRYVPILGTADERVHGWQLDGERAGTMTEAEWFERFAVMHREGAQMASDGRRTAADMRLNPAFDSEVLERLCAGDVAAPDDIDPTGLIERAGVGAMEIHMWVAAVAAHLSAGGGRDWVRYYAPIPEYGIAYGSLFDRPAGCALPA